MTASPTGRSPDPTRWGFYARLNQISRTRTPDFLVCAGPPSRRVVTRSDLSIGNGRRHSHMFEKCDPAVPIYRFPILKPFYRLPPTPSVLIAP